MNFTNCLMYFSAYSFLGWVLESTYASLKEKKFVNRGFLRGCFCPVYGFGALIAILSFKLIHASGSNQVITAIMGATVSMVLATILEYFGGFILHRFYGRRYWDYSHNQFNIGGYICPKYSILWGFLSLVLAKVIHPMVSYLLAFLPASLAALFSCALLVYFISDLILTSNAILQPALERRHNDIQIADSVSSLKWRGNQVI